MNKKCYICGDFNINLFHIHCNQRCSSHFENIMSHGFVSKITLPSLIQPTSFTLIDNIITNNFNNNSDSESCLN